MGRVERVVGGDWNWPDSSRLATVCVKAALHGHLHVLVWAWLADLATTATVRDTIDAYAVAIFDMKSKVCNL